MSSDHGFKFDPAKPALIVKCGNTTRKCRPLDKDVIVLGRAPGCDVGLDAPEVAPVHCVIARAGDGWRLRDCSGRLATRLNGQSVHDEPLRDADVLQIGPFSFQVHLPPEPYRLPAPVRAVTAPTDDGRLRRAQRSRRNLAQLALALRQRLRLAGASAQAETARGETALAVRQEQLDRQADALAALQRDVDARLVEMKRAAKEVAAREAALHARIRQAESAPPPAPAETTEAARRLDLRAGELAHYARGLLRARARMQEEQDRERREAEAQHQQRREELARSQAELREQRTEVFRMLNEMRELRQAARPPADPPAEARDRGFGDRMELIRRLKAELALRREGDSDGLTSHSGAAPFPAP